jgi:hypothetical protein
LLWPICAVPRPVARLVIIDNKAVSGLWLDLASKIVTVLNCGIGDLLEVVEG